MFSTFPVAPVRGRSRFSKALPVAPRDAPPSRERERELLPAPISKDAHSPLPPLPKSTAPVAIAIPRRPVPVKGPRRGVGVGVGVGVGSNMESTKAPSMKSESAKDSPSGVDSDAAGPTPPLPPKDTSQQQKGPATPNKLSKPKPNPNPSQPRTELWKRRSTRSDKNILFADLKLQTSNGSTASPPPKQEQLQDRAPPQSIVGRKPLPARPAPPQPDLMGNKVSIAKLRNRFQDETNNKSEDSGQNEAPKPNYPPLQRLPTPEYLKADKPQPPVPKVLSPASPSTPPNDEKPPALPRKLDSRAENIRPDVPRSSSQSTTIRPILSTHSRESSETLTITSGAPPLLALPSDKPFAAQLLTPQPSPDKTLALMSPSPTQAIRFPTVQSPAARGTIFPGLPLGDVHFNCYTSHKFMRSTGNTQAPIGCMICKRKDTKNRWTCTWCCLSACGSCMKVLTSIPGKDLKACLERIRK